MKKRHYKLSCVGVDNGGNLSRLNFFVYSVRGEENAERIVRKDRKRRGMMRRHNIDWKTALLSAVECDMMGNILDVEYEKKIRSEEMERLVGIKKEFDRKAKEEYWRKLELEKAEQRKVEGEEQNELL